MDENYKKFKDLEIGDYIYSFDSSMRRTSEVIPYEVLGKKKVKGNKYKVIIFTEYDDLTLNSNSSRTTIEECTFADRSISQFRYKHKTHIICSDLKVVETVMKNNWLNSLNNIQEEMDKLKNKMKSSVEGLINSKLSIISLELPSKK